MANLIEKRSLHMFLGILEDGICGIIDDFAKKISEMRDSKTVASSFFEKEMSKILKLIKEFNEVRNTLLGEAGVPEYFLNELRDILFRFFHELEDRIIEEFGIERKKASKFVEERKKDLENLINEILKR